MSVACIAFSIEDGAVLLILYLVIFIPNLSDENTLNNKMSILPIVIDTVIESTWEYWD
ncbi:hypothetical protein M2408_001761 [Sphingobacterium sp. BIGb0165]|nr:hypothetical protein [Sphingobacterium sp. BIGb0165]